MCGNNWLCAIIQNSIPFFILCTMFVQMAPNGLRLGEGGDFHHKC